MAVARGRGRRQWEVGVCWGQFQFGMKKGVLETDGGDGHTTMCMSLRPENATLKNGECGTFYVTYN